VVRALSLVTASNVDINESVEETVTVVALPSVAVAREV
jgi:hypothetical protein